jgi:hypothetical protein
LTAASCWITKACLHDAVGTQVSLAEFTVFQLGDRLRGRGDERRDGVVGILKGVHRRGQSVPGVGGRGVVNLLVLNRVAKLLHLVEELVHGFIL